MEKSGKIEKVDKSKLLILVLNTPGERETNLDFCTPLIKN